MSAAAVLLPTEQPCPRCSTPGIVYFHDAATCARDWQHRETTTRILTTEDAE
jgi:hypothetical protein